MSLINKSYLKSLKERYFEYFEDRHEGMEIFPHLQLEYVLHYNGCDWEVDSYNLTAEDLQQKDLELFLSRIDTKDVVNFIKSNFYMEDYFNERIWYPYRNLKSEIYDAYVSKYQDKYWLSLPDAFTKANESMTRLLNKWEKERLNKCLYQNMGQ